MIVRPDHFSGVKKLTGNFVFQECTGNYIGRQALTKTHDKIEHACCPLFHQENSMDHIIKLVDHCLYIGEYRTLALNVNKSAHGIEMPRLYLPERGTVVLISGKCLIA